MDVCHWLESVFAFVAGCGQSYVQRPEIYTGRPSSSPIDRNKAVYTPLVDLKVYLLFLIEIFISITARSLYLSFCAPV